MNSKSSESTSGQSEAIAPSANSFFERYEAELRRYGQLTNELLPRNKTTIFDELKIAQISKLVVNFDGSGDSGQIDSIDVFSPGNDAALPTSVVTLLDPKRDGSGYDGLSLGFEAALETLVYTLLEVVQGGWEIDDGSFGEFTFDVTDRQITLEFNKRVSEVEARSYSW